MLFVMVYRLARPLHFWDIAQRRFAFFDDGPILKGEEVQFQGSTSPRTNPGTSWLLKREPIACSETPVTRQEVLTVPLRKPEISLYLCPLSPRNRTVSHCHAVERFVSSSYTSELSSFNSFFTAVSRFWQLEAIWFVATNIQEAMLCP